MQQADIQLISILYGKDVNDEHGEESIHRESDQKVWTVL